MAMNFTGALNIAHLNVRKEKSGEDKGPVAVDIKLSGEVGIKAISGFFSTKSAFGVLDGLYLKGGELITNDVASLRLAGEAKDVKASIAVEGAPGQPVSFMGAKLNKIVLLPRAGRTVDLTARLQVYPTPDQHARLAELLESTVLVDLHSANMDLFSSAGEEEEEEEEEEEAGDTSATTSSKKGGRQHKLDGVH